MYPYRRTAYTLIKTQEIKIGILTFHYVTNYGAVLQAYALQTHLVKQGYNAVIIDYFPFTFQKKLHKRIFSRYPSVMVQKIINYLKEMNIESFRKKHFHLTKRYNSLVELQADPPDCDAYICGSDQIWNRHFTSKGEKKPTLSYFLDFGNEHTKRISYAASFGCTTYPPELINIVKPSLQRFNALSVRETTGRDILEDIGYHDVQLMPDPTLLLQKQDYEPLQCSLRKSEAGSILVYSLHPKQTTINTITNHLKTRKQYKIQYCGFRSYSTMGIEGWLTTIASARVVVTNSFHGAVFSILFEKPFISVPVEGHGAGMNDRLHTLLGCLGLEERMIGTFDCSKVNDLLLRSIDWKQVRKRIESLREKADCFLIKALK